MPVRYMRAASTVVNINPIISKNIDNANSHAGTPNGKRTIIMIGEVIGTIENQNDNVLAGS